MDALATALALLSQRELSETQLRERLVRRRFDPSTIDHVLLRLKEDGTLDDRRVAMAAARLESAIRGRGRTRVIQRLRALGIDPHVADEATANVFREVDESALLDRAIAKRLKGRSSAELDRRSQARIVRTLVAQGFSPGAVLARLRHAPDE